MQNRTLRSNTVVKITAFLALGSASTVLFLPGCSGGSGGFGNSSPTATPSPVETQNLAGTVSLGNNQTGTLAVRVFSNNTARGTFTIANNAVANNAVANNAVANNAVAQAVRSTQATTPFTVGLYDITGTYDSSTGHVTLSGSIGGFGPFTINVTPPGSTAAGSFVATFNGENFTGTIPRVTPTATPTTRPTGGPTATPTTAPTSTPGGQVPVGHGPLTISLTSSNNSLSGGSISTGTGATAVVDQLGTSTRINLVNGVSSLPPRLFNFLIAKSGTIKAGDDLTVMGDTGGNDVVSLTVTNLTNPANSGVFRGQSGTLHISSVTGKKVSFTIANLRMVSQTSSSSFNLNGSGSFTIE